MTVVVYFYQSFTKRNVVSLEGNADTAKVLCAAFAAADSASPSPSACVWMVPGTEVEG
jgi:hypothetical protein